MKKSSKILTIIGAVGLITAMNIGKVNAVTFYDTVGTKYEGAAERLADLGIVQGTAENVFAPNKKVTRAEFAKMLVEASLTTAEQNALNVDDTDVGKLKDVKKSDWYYKYVTIAVNRKYMQGYEDNTFRANKEVTYSEIAKLVTKALGHTYIREDDPRGWDALYLDKMISENLFNYVKFDSPHDSAIRGDVANIIWNMLKADKWEAFERSDNLGFSYRSTEKPLIDFTYVDHIALIDAKVNGFFEANGEVYAQINGAYYKVFDQKAKLSFSSIGGNSDVLLKRVEYPGPETSLEVVGISTDVGSRLYAGTYKELAEDEFNLTNKSKISPQADYAFLYHYEDDPEKDRAVAVNLSNTYLIDEIKVDDKTLEENKDAPTDHTEVENEFVDDKIAYRYEAKTKQFERTILINKDEAIIPGGAVVFKDNDRVEWSEVKKGDVLVEIAPYRYYMVQTGDTIDAILKGYSTDDNKYFIETDKGKFDSYKSTLFSDYTSNELKVFAKIKNSYIDQYINKKVRLTLDISDRVVKIEILEDNLKMADVNIGIFMFFDEQRDGKSGVLRVWQDGVINSFRTTTEKILANKGDFIQYKMDKDRPSEVGSISMLNGSAKLSDKIKLEPIKMEELANKLEYFEDDELEIVKITYHYKFEKYKYVDSVDLENVSIADCKDFPESKELNAYAVIDGEDIMKKVYIFDNTEFNNTYYGVVNRIYRNYKDGKTYINIKPVTVAERDAELTNTVTCQEGDFVVFQISEDGKQITVGEHFDPKNVGYFKDYVVKGINKGKNGKVESYLLRDFGELDMLEWAIDTDEKSYRLNNYEVFLLKVAYDDKLGWIITATERFTKDTAVLEIGDRIAVNEIEGTAIIYRGYTE